MPTSSAPTQFDCTNCGARLAIDGATRMVTCGYCRAERMLPDAIWLQFHPELAPRPAPQVVAVQLPAFTFPRGAVIGLVVGGIAALGGLIAAVVAIVGAAGAVGAAGMATPGAPVVPIASAGDPCNGRRAACAKDGKAELRCGTDGKMAVAGTCKGPNACRPAIDGKSITCDVTLADRGDTCDVTDDACSTDHKAELRCQAGHFAVIATCKGADGCTLTPAAAGKGGGYTLSCDDHVADVGDPCFDTERTACSSDKKALLTCTAQRYAVDHACKRGCTVKKMVGTGNTEMDCR
jgi:DNA-directed RNA polymerase subunit RPC12/RpoP